MLTISLREYSLDHFIALYNEIFTVLNPDADYSVSEGLFQTRLPEHLYNELLTTNLLGDHSYVPDTCSVLQF